MRFRSLAGEETSKEQLKREFKQAKYLAEIRLGENFLFYRNFIQVKYFSYDKIGNVYLRMERGESGEFLTIENYLVIRFKDGKECSLRIDSTENAKETLHFMKTHYPDITNQVPGREG